MEDIILYFEKKKIRNRKPDRVRSIIQFGIELFFVLVALPSECTLDLDQINCKEKWKRNFFEDTISNLRSSIEYR